MSLSTIIDTNPPLPDYRWVVKEQCPILKPQDLGMAESVSIYPEGLTFAANGDLLMAACCPGAAKTFIMRSANRGKTWMQQGYLEHKGVDSYPGNSGFVEGMTRTRSGRLVCIYYILRQKIDPTGPGYPYYVPQGNNFRFTHLSSRQWGAYSDDEGETWHYAPMDISPFKSMDAEASSQIFETEDGTLVASFRGHITQEEIDAGITSNGVIRSHDGGLSWGDANPIYRAIPGSGLWFNESQIVLLKDGRWLCMMRLNPNNVSGKGFLIMCRSYSSDGGRMWSFPVQTQFHGGEPGMGILPDGAICCTQTGGYDITVKIAEDGWPLWRADRKLGKLVYEISYNDGLIWSYWADLYVSEEGSDEHIGSPIIRPLDDNSAIAVYHRGAADNGRSGLQIIGASWLFPVPAGDSRAAKLKYSKE